MLESTNLIWEIIGIFALFFNLLSYLEKNDKKMFLLLAICSFFYGIHFLGLGLLTAGIINFVDVFKNIGVIKYKKNIYLFLFFSLIYFFIGIKTSNGEIISYLFTFASIISLYGAFYLRGISLRIVYLFVTSIYLIYSLAGSSFSGSLTYFIFIFVLLYSIYSLYQRRGFWGKIKYYKYLLHKKFVKIFFFKKKRLKFLG